MPNPKPFTPAELAAFQGRKGTDGWARMTCEELDRLLAMAGRAVSEETVGKLAESLVLESKWVAEGRPYNAGIGPENTAARRVFEIRVRSDLHEAARAHPIARGFAEAHDLAQQREGQTGWKR